VNGEGGIGQAEEDFGWLRGEFVTGFDYFRPAPSFIPNVNVPLGSIYSTIAAGIGAAQNLAVPDIYPTVTERPQGLPPPSAPRGETVLSPVIDPEAGLDVTVFEEEVATRGPVSPRPTDWDEFYDRYVILNPEVPVFNAPVIFPEVVINVPEPVEDEPVSVWTDVAAGVARAIFPLPSAAIDLYQGYNQPPGIVAGPTGTVGTVVPITGGVMPVAATQATCPPVGPKYAKICLATNTIMPLRQRRRRRLLTSSDLADLASLKALFGNSAGVQAALVKAVRR